MKKIDILSSITNLPNLIDIYELEEFLSFLPGRFQDFPIDYQQKLFDHFKESSEILEKQLENSKQFVAKVRQRCEDLHKKIIPEIIINKINKFIVQKYLILNEKMNKIKIKMASMNLHVAENQYHIIKSLLLFTNWLIENPYPIYININRAMPGIDALAFSKDQLLFKQHRAVKLAFREQILLLNQFPPLFRSTSENKNFVRCAVDMALSSRKPGINYFEPLSIEDQLFHFFDCSTSPLIKHKLIPINVLNDFESISEWINLATNIITKFDSIDNIERKDVINIFMIRYIFERTYPLLQPESKYHHGFSRTMKKISEMNPIDLLIPKQFIPENLLEKPIYLYFEQNSISLAPIEWLKIAQFKICPLDVAFCIFKVHESLSILTTLQASGNKNGISSEDFFNKMPGFDDIFDIWIALICVSGIIDPHGLNDFISKWSRLIGFPSRFLACCAYLEASILQIEEKSKKNFKSNIFKE